MPQPRCESNFHDNTITKDHYDDSCRNAKKPNEHRQTKTSKMIKKNIRTIKNEERRNSISNFLSIFRRFKNTSSIKTRRKKILVTHMQCKTGDSKYDRQDIADVFAEFYEDLNTSTTKKHEHEHEDKYEQHQDTLRPFAMQEIADAINQLKRGKAADTRGVNAEMIK